MSESSEWSKNNTVGWLPDTPTDLVFRAEPWEGQIGYNNIGASSSISEWYLATT